MIKTGVFYEQPGGVIIAPNGRQVLKFDVEQMYLDDYERAMRCVIVALANEFGKERVNG